MVASTVPWWEGPLPDEPSARIIADSVSPAGHRLTTFEMRFHRYVLAEVNTHTLFSRNSESSRAVPYRLKRERVLANPALPVSWPVEKPGMQGGEEMDAYDAAMAEALWLTGRDVMVQIADALTGFQPDPDDPVEYQIAPREPLHKSVANRLLEPFMYHTATVSAVDWEGFFKQRSYHHTPMAQAEFAVVATQVEDLYRDSVPTPIGEGEWHTPYIRPEERDEFEQFDLCRLSTARCARTSYLGHDGSHDVGKDFGLYDRLANPGDGPPHASPFQHVATPDADNEACYLIDPAKYGLIGDVHQMRVPIVGNARGFMQLRHIVLGL